MANKRFIKGLFKDTAYIDQPEGSWRHAINTIANDKKGSISNEGGTDLDTTFISDTNIHHFDKVVGAIEVNNDRVVLFMVDINPNAPLGTNHISGLPIHSSMIGIWEEGLFTRLYDPDVDNAGGHDLNFNINYPIEGTFKIDSRGDLIVYFTDDYNPPRAFNVSRQERYLATASPNTAFLYGIDPWKTHENHINFLNLFPHSGPVPHIDLDYFINHSTLQDHQRSVIEGGGLRTGVYYLALAYVDENFVSTNFLTVSNPVSIVEEYDHTKPTQKKDGMKAGGQTSKSIKWKVSNLKNVNPGQVIKDQVDYKFLRPVVIRKIGGATEAFRLNDIDLSLVEDQGVVFSGVEGFIPSSVEDVIIDTISYETAKTINQLDGILYLGNLTGTSDIGYQKYANNIKLTSVVKDIEDFDQYWATVDELETGSVEALVDAGQFVDHTKSYRYLPNATKFRGYMRDEVYAFYIAFILTDGSMSYAYHIPGRDSIDDGLEMPCCSSGCTPPTILETGDVPSDGLYNDLRELSIGYSRNFQFFDFSSIVAGANALSSFCRHMNYWENATEFYPNTENYEVWDSTGQIGSLVEDGIYNTSEVNVRHHHFPSNENVDRKTIVDDNCDITDSEDLHPGFSSLSNYVIERWSNQQPCNGGWSYHSHEASAATFLGFDDCNTGKIWSGCSLFYGSPGTGAIGCTSAGGPWLNASTMAPLLGNYNTGGTVDSCFADVAQGHVFTADRPMGVTVEYGIIIELSNRKGEFLGNFNQLDSWHCTLAASIVHDSAIQAGNPGSMTNCTGATTTGSTAFWTPKRSLICTKDLTGSASGIEPIAADEQLAQNINSPNPCCENMYPWECYSIVGLSSAEADFNSITNPPSLGVANGNAFAYPSTGYSETFTLDPGDTLRLDVRAHWNNVGGVGSAGIGTQAIPVSSGDMTGNVHFTGQSYNVGPIDVSPNLSGNITFTSPDTNVEYVGYHWIRYTINSNAGFSDFVDAKISHKVRRLGFKLDDIQIPQDMADKIQGFRIYYAKRGHEDRRVLGQAPLLPMLAKEAIVGECQDAYTNPVGASQEIMKPKKLEPVKFWQKYPYPFTESLYPLETLDYGNSCIRDHTVYEAFSFHDFNLLRTKNSLAGATHIKPEYRITNLVWNNPVIEQDAKMMSKMVADTTGGGTPILTVDTFWGWDTTWNCYAHYRRGGIFMGKTYTHCYTSGSVFTDTSNADPPIGLFNNFTSCKVLGQKAKTYLRGDSMFKGGSLGFGELVFNELGESCAIFSLKNGHEIESLPNFQDNSSLTSLPFPDFTNNYGFHDQNSYPSPILVNPCIANPTFPCPGTAPAEFPYQRSNYYMVNLHSYKTDIYKSIDSQELVWTGFEVLGEDLNNFIFDDSGTPKNYTYWKYTDANGDPLEHDADFSTSGLQNDVQVVGGSSIIDDSDQDIFGGDTFICRYGFASSVGPNNTEDDSRPIVSIHYHIVESPDNINFRHVEDDKSLSFPSSVAKEMLEKVGNDDYSHVDNMKYNKDYSEVNDIRPAFPLPLRETKQTDFPTRTHRSVKNDPTSLIDNYRLFLANQFKDLPKNRGELWKLSTFSNLLYFHMEETLYVVKGKQTMEMKDGSEAFVGSGDIFAQEPDEIIQTESGFGGTQSQWAALTTRYGYFFIDRNSRKVFLMKDSLTEISSVGMESWFRDNLIFALESFGMSISCTWDNPIIGMGFHSIWDPKYKRILLTKRDLEPTRAFLNGYNSTVFSGTGTNCQNYPQNLIRFSTTSCKFRKFSQTSCSSSPCPCTWTDIEWDDETYFTKTGGWTISYYFELGVWVSFHDYIPYIYFNTNQNFYSITDIHPHPTNSAGTILPWNSLNASEHQTYAQTNRTVYGNAGIWKHNSNTRGILYQENELPGTSGLTNAAWLALVEFSSFEFEFIHNQTKDDNTIFSSFNYTSETFNDTGISVLEHGFTSFFLYNTFQISGEEELEYLINTRRIGDNWKVNRFRDMAAIALDNTAGGYYMSTNTNVIGGINTGTITTSSINNMFTIDGMSKTINALYLNTGKTWDQQKKFIDKWVGIRLIYNNITNNLLNLYSTNVETRKLYR